MMLDAQEHFAAGAQGGRNHEVEGAADRAFGGVFHGGDGIIGLAGFHQAEAFVDGGVGLGAGSMAEVLHGGLLGEGGFGAEVGDGERAFYSEAFAHDFAEQAGDGFVGQEAGGGLVQALNALQHLGFALGAVDDAGAFELADGAGVGGALVEQAEDFGVDGVDGLAVGGKGLVWHGAAFVRVGDGLIV